MAERREKPVETVEVHMGCDCGGELVPTGIVLACLPPLYPHECDRCGKRQSLGKPYPAIEYRTP